jgi:hypothetical protein
MNVAAMKESSPDSITASAEPGFTRRFWLNPGSVMHGDHQTKDVEAAA